MMMMVKSLWLDGWLTTLDTLHISSLFSSSLQTGFGLKITSVFMRPRYSWGFKMLLVLFFSLLCSQTVKRSSQHCLKNRDRYLDDCIIFAFVWNVHVNCLICRKSYNLIWFALQVVSQFTSSPNMTVANYTASNVNSTMAAPRTTTAPAGAAYQLQSSSVFVLISGSILTLLIHHRCWDRCFSLTAVHLPPECCS